MITHNSIKDISLSLANQLEENEPTEAPDGLCPNCWGSQEYGGKFYEAVKTHGLDANTKDTNVGWIEDYVEKNLLPIKLEPEGDDLVCGSCKVSFKAEK